MAFRANSTLWRAGAIAAFFATPALADVSHLDPPARFEPCIQAYLSSGGYDTMMLPAAILVEACNADDIWGCLFEDQRYFSQPMIAISSDAPDWLYMRILRHELAHACGWGRGHGGGTWNVAGP